MEPNLQPDLLPPGLPLLPPNLPLLSSVGGGRRRVGCGGEMEGKSKREAESRREREDKSESEREGKSESESGGGELDRRAGSARLASWE